jgi:hypothetical protein
MENQLSLTVSVKPNDENVSVIITYPKEQRKLSLLEMSQMLTGGISLIIKLAGSEENESVKDYEIIERVIKQLNEDFISTQSFDDAKRIG